MMGLWATIENLKRQCIVKGKIVRATKCRYGKKENKIKKKN